MNLHQINRFIKRVYPDQKVKVCYCYDKSKYAFVAESYPNRNPPEIRLNKATLTKFYTSRGGLYLKSVILHELGHIDDKPQRIQSERELFANLFALKKIRRT